MAKKKKRKKAQGLSVTVMVVCLMVAAAYLCWALAASTYFGAIVEPIEPGTRPRRSAGLQLILAAFISFLVNSVRLDAIPAVFANSLRNHPWHFGLFFGLEAAAVLFGFGVKRLETQLHRPLRGETIPDARVVESPQRPRTRKVPRKRP